MAETALDLVAMRETVNAVIQSSSTADLLNGRTSERIVVALQPSLCTHDAKLTENVRRKTLREMAPKIDAAEPGAAGTATSGGAEGETRADICPVCGDPMDYVCGPDGNSGGMHCWACYDANPDTTTDRDGRVYEFPNPGAVNFPKPPTTAQEPAAPRPGTGF